MISLPMLSLEYHGAHLHSGMQDTLDVTGDATRKLQPSQQTVGNSPLPFPGD